MATVSSAAPPRTAAGPWSWGARAGGLVGVGDLPAGTWGVEALLQVHAPGPAGPTIFAAAELWPRQQASSDQSIDLSLQIATGRAGLCPVERRWAAHGLSLCAALALGRLDAEGKGSAGAYHQDRWRASADAGVGVTERLYGGWSAALEARLVVPFRRDRITVTDSAGAPEVLFRAAPVGGVAALSVGYTPNSSDR